MRGVRFDRAERLRGEIVPPPDKSISHRAALLGGMSAGTVRIANYLHAADATSTLNALRQVGAHVELRNGDVVIRGAGLRLSLIHI